MNVAWVVLHRKIAHIGARETETADTTCALSGSISGAGKSIEIRLRMCGPPLHLERWTTSVDFLICCWRHSSHCRHLSKQGVASLVEDGVEPLLDGTGRTALGGQTVALNTTQSSTHVLNLRADALALNSKQPTACDQTVATAVELT